MMDFAEAWDGIDLGAEVRVSDGSAEPSVEGSLPHKAWSSHNFTATLVEKVEEAPRCLRFVIVKEWGELSPCIPEGGAHRFARTTPILADAVRDKIAAIEARTQAAFLSGYRPTTPNLAGQTLQVRDEKDRTNWLTSQAAYSAAVSAGQGEVMGAKFRTLANETIALSYQEGLDALLGMAEWGAEIMQAAWVLKDEVRAETTIAGVEAIDIEEAPWPA